MAADRKHVKNVSRWSTPSAVLCQSR